MADYPTIKKRARQLRKNMTPQEKRLWQVLRNRNLDGFKFLRQHPFIFEGNFEDDHYILDFYCHEKKLCIEIDGKYHEEQKEYDRLRDLALKERGIRTLRIKNETFNDFPKVVMKIRVELGVG